MNLGSNPGDHAGLHRGLEFLNAMKLQPVKSSNIESVGYDAASKTMHVKFRSGSTHQYSGITSAAHAAFVGAKSLGGHYATHVRGRYPSKKLEV